MQPHINAHIYTQRGAKCIKWTPPSTVSVQECFEEASNYDIIRMILGA